MLIIPAIDIKDGKVVRLTQGRYQKKIYSNDPLKTARHWQRLGARLIHIVDLDGASSGKTVNFQIIKRIAQQIHAPIEVGGGIRDLATIKKLLGTGIERVIIGTKAAEDEAFLKRVFKQFKERVIVSIDSIDGSVFTHGWLQKNKKTDALRLAKKIKTIGFEEIIFTDIVRDGALKGPNIAGIKKILKTGLKVIGSGGVSTIQDIFRLKALRSQGLTGIIVGKALYEGRFTLKEANRIVLK